MACPALALGKNPLAASLLIFPFFLFFSLFSQQTEDTDSNQNQTL
jgi:hypothetical protein